jgi:hypothetical protein
MIPGFALLKGPTLGQTVYNVLAAAALLGVLSWVGIGVASGKFWKWRAHSLEDRAIGAENRAATAETNAANANGSAANATQTRAAIDAGTLSIRVTTEQAAGRVEYGAYDIGDDGSLPPDLVRDVDAAHDRARAAANRLQRKGPR